MSERPARGRVVDYRNDSPSEHLCTSSPPSDAAPDCYTVLCSVSVQGVSRRLIRAPRLGSIR